MDNDMNTDPADRALSAFREQFHAEPETVVRAPGRVNLIGDHVDYAGGFVLPIAIERSTVLALSQRDTTESPDGSVIHALDLDMTNTVDLASQQPPEPQDSPHSFLNYIRGPIEEIRSTGVEIPQLSLTLASSIPMGGGLSSSAALEVAVLIAVRTLLHEPIEPRAIALEAQHAEHTYAGTPCGIMDMYVSAAARPGMACLIDCTTNELSHIPMPKEEEAIILITDTATRHELNTGAYAQRRKSCEEAAETIGVELLGQASIEDIQRAKLSETTERRARHVIEEIRRVLDFAETIQQGNLKDAGKLMYESHESLRTQFEVSCPELDLLVEIARSSEDEGVYGCRMTGGGFGGCTVTLCRRESVPNLIAQFEEGFSAKFGRIPQSFATRPAAGAGVIDVAEK